MKKSKKISIDCLADIYSYNSYDEFAKHINDCVRKGILSPIVNSGTNGRVPRLYNRYWQYQDNSEIDFVENNLKNLFYIGKSYYIKHPKILHAELKYVIQLNEFLLNKRNLLNIMVSDNERSMQIWNKEKFWNKGIVDSLNNVRITGRSVVSHCCLRWEDFNTFSSFTPISKKILTTVVPQNILIVENQSTYSTLCNIMSEDNMELMGMTFGTIVCGSGYKAVKMFRDFSIHADEYLMNNNNKFFYWGDMDYEGIKIYNSICNNFKEFKLNIATVFYKCMLKKGCLIESCLSSPGGTQIPCDINSFFDFLDEEAFNAIRRILSSGKYIPQEIITAHDFCKGGQHNE